MHVGAVLGHPLFEGFAHEFIFTQWLDYNPFFRFIVADPYDESQNLAR